jgi:molybdopterin-guanine dinucleotide biosynthesis protein A
MGYKRGVVVSRRGRGQEKAQKNGSVLQNFSRLPVFLLSGGTEGSRVDFVRRLLNELTERSLTGAFLRRGDGSNLYSLTLLARRYDLVIVNSGLDTPEQPITLGAFAYGKDSALPWSCSWEEGWPGLVAGLLEKLQEYCQRTPVWGCILIGGKSSRMGHPKHLLKDRRGNTWLENTLAVLQPLLDGIVISGAGELPEKVAAATLRLPDIPGVAGPLTGILAAGRWQPLVSWLLVACDMPHVSPEAVSWLLTGRRPGCWGRVPKLAGNDRLEPLLAWYDFRSIALFEEQLYTDNMRIGEAAGDFRIDHPVIPEALRHAWENINTPEQLQLVVKQEHQ